MKSPTKTGACSTWRSPAPARGFTFRAVHRVARPFPVPTVFCGPILDKVLADARTSRLFHRRAGGLSWRGASGIAGAFACGTLGLAAARIASRPPATEFRRIAKQRAGFVVTSYTGVKRRHGGFVVPEEPADLSTANEPSEPDCPRACGSTRACARAAVRDLLARHPGTGSARQPRLILARRPSGPRSLRSRSFSLGSHVATNAIPARSRTPRTWSTRRSSRPCAWAIASCQVWAWRNRRCARLSSSILFPKEIIPCSGAQLAAPA